MQEASVVLLGNGTTLKVRATTLVLPFWGCLAKLADELTGKTVRGVRQDATYTRERHWTFESLVGL